MNAKYSALPSVEEKEFRNGMRCLVTGVCVVTSRYENRYCALTATSIMSVSLRPPVVAVSVNIGSETSRGIDQTQAFGISILRRDQVETADYFATNGLRNKLDHVPFRIGLAGIPLLDPAHAAIECIVVGCQLVGDHHLYLGRVVCAVVKPDSEPLAYHSARYGTWMVTELVAADPMDGLELD